MDILDSVGSSGHLMLTDEGQWSFFWQDWCSPGCHSGQMTSFLILPSPCRFKVREEEAESHRKPRISSQRRGISELQGPGGGQ